ncbi:g8669 [Coccomyxa elongata]
MATSNRSVKAVLLPRPPIRTKEAGKLRISRNTNTDSFIGDHEIPADSAVYDDAEGKATVEVEVTVIDAWSGDRQIAEEEEHGLGKKRGAKKGKRAPYLEAMQRNLHLFMPLTSEGVYLLVSASFPYLSAKATTNDEELIAWFNKARELLYLHTTLDVGGQIGWTRQLFMDRLNKLHVLNKKPATARPEVKELQDCFAEREKTTLMRTVEASRHEIQLRSMKGPKEVIGRNSGLSSEEEANTCYQISDRSATNAAAGDRDNCRMPTPRFTQEALKVDPGFCLDRFLVAASRWVLPKRLPSGRSGRGVRPTAVCVGASTAGGDTGLFSSIHSWGIFNEDLSSQMAPARLHAGIHRRRAAGLNADDDATP